MPQRSPMHKWGILFLGVRAVRFAGPKRNCVLWYTLTKAHFARGCVSAIFRTELCSRERVVTRVHDMSKRCSVRDR